VNVKQVICAKIRVRENHLTKFRLCYTCDDYLVDEAYVTLSNLL